MKLYTSINSFKESLDKEDSLINNVNESVNANAKEELKRQFRELEALNKLDPWDIIAVLNELKIEFSY